MTKRNKTRKIKQNSQRAYSLSNPKRNDWDGIILIGDAPNNIPDAIQYGRSNNQDEELFTLLGVRTCIFRMFRE